MTTPATAIPEVLDPATDAGRRAARQRWWFLAAVFVIAPIGLLLMAMLAVVVWFYGQHAAALAKVRAEVARIQAAGEPITTDDLYARSRVPSGTNDSTPRWLAALGTVDEMKFNADAKPLPIVGEVDGSALPAGDVAVAEQLLAKYDATVQATLSAAAADGECRFAVEFNDGFSALLPNTQKMRMLSRMMALRARVAAARGNPEQAVESVEAMFEASRTLANQQLLIEHLVRLATAGTALRETEFLLNEAQLTDEQITRLRVKVEALNFQQGLIVSVMGERGMGYHMFRHPEQFDMNAGDFTKKAGAGPGNITRGADCLVYLELQRDMIDAAREPFPSALDKVDLVEQRLKTLAGTGNPLEKFKHMFTLLIMPAMSSSFQATGRNLAQRDLVLCALAARQYQHKQGELPASLEILVPDILPAVPNDPFDGQPLRLQTAADGLTLYSIGRDRKDDGGTDPEQKSEPDIVVRLTKTSSPKP